MQKHQHAALPVWRKQLVWALLGIAVLVLVWRAYDLQISRRDFLTVQGDARRQRVVEVFAHRGMITDRNGEPLAISTPVDSIWVNPEEILATGKGVRLFAKKMRVNAEELQRKLLQHKSREFVYIKRHMAPFEAEQIMQLGVNGVYTRREYRRYYPMGEVSAHLVGFTNIDDHGQEGVERMYDSWLRGANGLKRVMKDRFGRVIKDVENIRSAKSGQSLRLSIDKRLQYLAYRELKAAVQKHNAISGTVVMLDSNTGEVLAMVNQPAFNPNNRSELKSEYYRNRAVTDVLEPGSTVKPFTMAAALESGKYTAASKIDTWPGFIVIGNYKIRDHENYATLDIAGILRKSSNVGASRIALSLPAEYLWQTFDKFGFGKLPATHLASESPGYLPHFGGWGKAEQAAISYGYGLSVTPLQLAQAYSALANDGRLKRASVEYGNATDESEALVSEETARTLRRMLAGAVQEGTGRLAGVAGYSVAGKTGTVHKSIGGGYAEDRYFAVFAGMAPVENPRLVMVVVINEPRQVQYHGGDVAAPVFGKIMADALRLLDVPPDNLSQRYAHTLKKERDPT